MMIKFNVLWLKPLFFLLIVSAAPLSQSHAGDDSATSFKNIQSNFLSGYWDLRPSLATAHGMSAHFGKLEMRDKDYSIRLHNFAETQRRLLSTVQPATLSEAVDIRLMNRELDRLIWEFDQFQPQAWDPTLYNFGRPLAAIMRSGELDAAQRSRRVVQLLESAPAYYAQAQRNIAAPSKPHVELAVTQSKGLLKTLDSYVASREIPDTPVLEGARQAIGDYILFLEKLTDFRSPRIGCDLFEDKFRFEIGDGHSVVDFYTKAERTRAEARTQLEDLAAKLWERDRPSEPPSPSADELVRQVLHGLRAKHASRLPLIDTIRMQLAESEAFVLKKSLFKRHAFRPIVVRPMPDFQRGIHTITLQPRGVFDSGGRTFYNVVPIEDRPKEQQAILAEKNNVLEIRLLNVHEATPGHYWHMEYSRTYATPIQNLFGTNTTAEGWASYAEVLMFEQGFFGNDLESQFLNAYSQIRISSRLMLDYKVHCLGSDEHSVKKFIADSDYVGLEEADEVWARAITSQVQYSTYYAGLSEILELRQMFGLKNPGPEWLRNFHENFLRWGSIPIAEIRRAMLSHAD